MCNLNLGKAIKELREKNKMSQWDLHHETGLKPGYISKLENGKILWPKLPTVFKLAKALGIKPSELICMAEEDGKISCECVSRRAPE